MTERVNTAKWLENQKRWQIKVQKNGVRKTFNSSKPGRAGQREANAKADAWLAGDHLATQGKKNRLMIKDLYPQFIEYKKAKTREQWKKDLSAGENWILPEIGKKKIDKLTEGDIDDIIIRAFKEGDLSKKSLENIRGTIQNFLKWCRKKKLTSLRPEDIEIPAGAKVGERNILQPEDLAKLFESDKTTYCDEVITDPYIHNYRFLVLTGCRPGEHLGIEAKNISGDILTLQRSINVNGEETTGKNENAKRRFYLTALAKEEIKEQRKLFPENKRIFGDDLREPYLLGRWHEYCKYNGIPHTTLYELRHTFISVIKGLPEGEIKPLVGHSRNMDTTGVYSHEVKGDLQRVSNKIQNIFESIIKSEEMDKQLEDNKYKIS